MGAAICSHLIPYNMQQYRVKALSVGGKNNKIYKSGDVVDAGCFSSSVSELVAQGFLEPISGGLKQESKSESKSTTTTDVDAVDVDVNDGGNDAEDSAVNYLPAYDDISKKVIIDMLESKGLVKNVNFKQSQGKSELYELLKSLS